MDKLNVEESVKKVVEKDLRMSGIDKTQLRFDVTIHKPNKEDKFRNKYYVRLSILNNLVSDVLPVTISHFELDDFGFPDAKSLAREILRVMEKNFPDAKFYQE